MCVFGTISRVGSLTTGLGDKKETPTAVLEQSDPLESDPLLAFIEVP